MAPSGDVISVSESYKTMRSPMRPTKMKAMVAPEALLLADPRTLCGHANPLTLTTK